MNEKVSDSFEPGLLRVFVGVLLRARWGLIIEHEAK